MKSSPLAHKISGIDNCTPCVWFAVVSILLPCGACTATEGSINGGAPTDAVTRDAGEGDTGDVISRERALDAGEGGAGDVISRERALDAGDDGVEPDAGDTSPGLCGNGVVDQGEQCDIAIAGGMPGACPTSCDDSVACTSDALDGSGCQASCTHDPVTACEAGDGCCPAGCETAGDDDCIDMPGCERTKSTMVVSGTVTGLADGEQLVLQLNRDPATNQFISADGTFSFASTEWFLYEVTIESGPTRCQVVDGVGVAEATMVDDVRVVCGTTSPGTYSHISARPPLLLVDGSDRWISSTESNYGWFTTRRLTDGNLDSSFDGDGMAMFSSSRASEPSGMAVTNGDGLILTGQVGGSVEGADGFMSLRYTEAGALDTGWGMDGIVGTYFFDIGGHHADDVAVQPNGKVIVSGRISNASVDMIGVVRYEADGTLDSTFGTDGVFTLIPPSTSGLRAVEWVWLDTAGRIVVGFTDALDGGGLLRLTRDGELDTSFGTDGIVTGLPEGVMEMTPDGSILVGLATDDLVGSATGTVEIIKLLPDGSGRDTSFGVDGIVTLGKLGIYGWLRVNDIAVSDAGDIVVTGQTPGQVYVDDYEDFDAIHQMGLVARMDASGKADLDFSTCGITPVSSFRSGQETGVGGAAFASDGSLGVSTYNEDNNSKSATLLFQRFAP